MTLGSAGGIGRCDGWQSENLRPSEATCRPSWQREQRDSVWPRCWDRCQSTFIFGRNWPGRCLYNLDGAVGGSLRLDQSRLVCCRGFRLFWRSRGVGLVLNFVVSGHGQGFTAWRLIKDRRVDLWRPERDRRRARGIGNDGGDVWRSISPGAGWFRRERDRRPVTVGAEDDFRAVGIGVADPGM